MAIGEGSGTDTRIRTLVWPPASEDEQPGRMLWFCATATVVGALTGLVAAAFRLCLEFAGERRREFASWAGHLGWPGVLLVVAVCAIGTAFAVALVHLLEPHAEGSGIPRVEAIVEGRLPPGRPLILPVKFLGGVAAIGSGLALGREGPSVQMGGNIAIVISRLLRQHRSDMRVLVAAGAAAGLATAFNAPIAGAAFVLEELFKKFDTRTTIATLLASGTGAASALLLTGDMSSMFGVLIQRPPSLTDIPIVLLLGVIAGAAGVGYNKCLMASLRRVDASRVHVVWRGMLIGAIVGMVVVFAPDWAGGGDLLTQRALHNAAGGIGIVALTLGVRFVLSVMSYSACAPGGIFAPMLVLGSHVGLLVGLIGDALLPTAVAPEPVAMAIIGMAAFFTGSVRAPLTGMVLAVELTGVSSYLPPMLGACALAMLVARVLRDQPIYDALADRSAANAKQNRAERR